MAAPGMMPPLNLSMGSSAKSGDAGGTAGGQGMGALNQGAWTWQKTGTGNNSATLPAPGGNALWMLGIGAAVVWFLKR